MKRRRRAFDPVATELERRDLLTTFTPTQLAHAYGLDAVNFTSGGKTVKGDGSGQTIAIVVAYHDPNLAADLHTFDQRYGLPDPTLSQVNLAGNATDVGWAGEESMDVEWAHAIAPGAKILVVEARSDSTNDLIAAVDRARATPGVSVVSMSWGGSEWSGQTVLDSHFTTPAGHTGITFIAASGDSGASAGAEWPSSSANVIAVGGTTLQLNTSGNYGSERIWSGSGSGTSRYVSEPSYQYALQSTGRKVTADVGFVGDPGTGVMVYSTAPGSSVGSWGQYGGTSLGAPAWAAIVAIADQGRTLAGKGTLDGATQTLPALYALPSSDWHKIANVTSSFGFRWFRQTTTQTVGLGTPAGATLVTDLANYGTNTASAASSTPSTPTRAPSWYQIVIIYGQATPNGSTAPGLVAPRGTSGAGVAVASSDASTTSPTAAAPWTAWLNGAFSRARNAFDNGARPALGLFGLS